MSKDEAWQECLDAFRLIHQDRCIELDCGCDELIEEVREAIYV
jgi:hypothetical protein